jgi:hypothetical protein
MSVIAKFYVSSVTPPAENTSGGTVVHLGAVCRGAANSTWASATPAGSIQMTIRNDAASEQFVMGDEYEVIFRKVDKPVQGDGHSVQAAHPTWAPESWVCGVCGQYPDGQVYGVVVEDPATLDWSKHDEHFGSAT